MNLSINKINRANVFFIFLRKQSEEYLKEQKIFKCKKCGGLGLGNVRTIEIEHLKSSSWDASTYCDECEGIGYIGVREGIQIDLLHYMCGRCGGLGCLDCDEGVVDWIDHSMGR